jgi:cytochrome c oxidase assembly protein subunit 15
VRFWLLALAVIIFAMVVVGGATRLTGSGLSITEWKPLVGTLPPLSERDWLDAFEKYKQIPQYILINKGMSLDAFKAIFWWEWGHRLLGRVIGLAFIIPFVWFWLRGKLDGPIRNRLLTIFALGGLQGFIGWYMVKSGLADRTEVSQYRLALHLSLAVLIFGAILWVVDPLRVEEDRTGYLETLPRSQSYLSVLILVLVFIQIALGALVAGLRAGLSHNTWPLMDGHLIPPGLFIMQPWWLNIFENVMTVQFDHRTLAYVVVALTVWHAWQVRKHADSSTVCATANWLFVAVLLQVALGIWTLLAVVPISLGLAHQAGAMIVFALAVLHARAVLQMPAASPKMA